MIKGSTNIVALIGHPVEHSFSPPMHNRAFEKLNMDYAYVAFDVEPANLKSAIEGAKALNIKGFNVTIPHKISVMEFLDEIDEVASLIGAVNTIDFKNMKGYNTDGIGAVKAIEEVTSIKGKNVVIAGAGGASRAISFYIAKYGADTMTILNRNPLKAQNLASDVSNSGLIGEVKSDSISEINAYLADADILIDTTPVGMHPNVDVKPIVRRRRRTSGCGLCTLVSARLHIFQHLSLSRNHSAYDEQRRKQSSKYILHNTCNLSL